MSRLSLSRRHFGSTTSFHSDVVHDPISGLIIAGLTKVGFSTAAASIIGSLAVTAVVAGIQYAMTPKPPKPENGRQPLQQAIPNARWAVGRCRQGGAYMLWTAKGSYLYGVQALVGHRSRSINRYWIGDDEVVVDGQGKVLPGSDGRYGKSGKPVMDLHSRIGNVPEVPYPFLVEALAANDVWTAAHRLDGTTSLAWQAKSVGSDDYQKTYPGQKPVVSAEGDWALVWDFRNPAQDPNNPATWGWSDNSVLILAWHLCFNPFGERKDYRRAILPVVGQWWEEADVCDELVACADGSTERRYTCAGWDTTENGPKGGTNAILASFDGWMAERGDGAILVVAGKFREKYVTTLTDADITGARIENDVLPDEEVNRLTPKFNYPDTGYTTQDADFWEDVDAQNAIGRIMPDEADYRFVTKWRQARRLSWREFRRVRQKQRGQIYSAISGINAVWNRWVRLQAPKRLPRLNNVLVENRRSRISILQGGFQIDFVRHPADIDTWTPAMEGKKPPVPLKPTDGAASVPNVVSVVPVPQNGSVTLRATIADPGRDDLGAVLLWRLKDQGGGVPGAWVEQVVPSIAKGGNVVIQSGPVPPDTMLQVQVMYRYPSGIRSDPKPDVPIEVATTADVLPPGKVTNLKAQSQDTKVYLSFNAPNSGNYRSATIYRGSTDVEANAVLRGTVYGPPSGEAKFEDTAGNGTWFYFVRSRNASDLESDSASVSVKVTLNDN
ncbi:hypothetical protein [Tianweitania sp.]|uniref:hypothetical protein n=1 Tax=Tianweitania sp. TaxID=2021634 RepID=UPI0028A09924|nr:hypothetical protein [Tianweitania sp.]